MIHLAIENSGDCSIALQIDGQPASFQNNLHFGRDCDKKFLPFLTNFLRQHGISPLEITHWSIGTGPGSFAGIRFILALVKGICTVTHARSRGIPSSYPLACTMKRDGNIAILQDARCGMFFHTPCASQNGHIAITGEATLIPQENAASIPCDAAGTPAADLFPALSSRMGTRAVLLDAPEAIHLLDAPEDQFPWLDKPEVEPLYVRPPA